MNVTLQKYGEAVHDITPLLDDETEQALDQVLERRAFQRAVDDIELHCSNARRFFSDLFIGMAPTARWEVVVRGNTGRILFNGEIFNKSIIFDVRHEWVTFEVYSCTKQFWDICKATRIAKAISEGGGALFITLASLIQREATLERMNGVIAGYRIDPLYHDRPIRFWNYTGDSEIGNNSRYRDLDPRTTLDELFKAISIYYNAEFFVDPETRELVMQKRGAIHNDVEHNLNDILDEEEEIDIQLFDEEKVDYVALSLNLGEPSALRLKSTGKEEASSLGLDPGRYQWAYTNLFQAGGIVVESAIGPTAEVTLPPSPSGSKYNVVIEIPAGPISCTGRKIYRTRNAGIGTMFLTGELQGNAVVDFVDRTPNSQLAKPAPQGSPTGNVYMRYDEQTGVWEDPVVEDPIGLNRPRGEIFEVTPKLRFLQNPFGNGFEIGAVYPLEGKTRFNTKTAHNFSEGIFIRILDTETTPSIDGVRMVTKVFPDGVTVEIDGMVVSSSSRGGTAIRLIDEEKIPPLETALENIFDVFAFFGKETDLTKFQQQWIDMFQTKRKGRMTVKGIDFRIGDSVLLTRDFNKLTLGKGVIKKANNRLFTERTQLEVISV